MRGGSSSGRGDRASYPPLALAPRPRPGVRDVVVRGGSRSRHPPLRRRGERPRDVAARSQLPQAVKLRLARGTGGHRVDINVRQRERRRRWRRRRGDRFLLGRHRPAFRRRHLRTGVVRARIGLDGIARGGGGGGGDRGGDGGRGGWRSTTRGEEGPDRHGEGSDHQLSHADESSGCARNGALVRSHVGFRGRHARGKVQYASESEFYRCQCFPFF